MSESATEDEQQMALEFDLEDEVLGKPDESLPQENYDE